MDLFGYHESKYLREMEVKSTTENIKGLELELDCWDYDVESILEELENDDVILTPYNQDGREKQFMVTVENDGSVDCELVFKANKNRNLLRAIKALNEYGLNDEYVCNSSHTSCHIHLNRQYLRTENLDELDIVKAGEFIAPLLYKVSGRTRDSLGDWCRSQLACDIIENLYTRAKLVDNVIQPSIRRYNIVNIENSSTIELRIFSNAYNFNRTYIKLYLDLSDFIVQIAKAMKSKRYLDEYDELISLINDFFNETKVRQKIADKHGIFNFLINKNKAKLNALIEEKNKLISRFEVFHNRFDDINDDDMEKIMSFIRIIRDFSSISLKYDLTYSFDVHNYNELENQMIEIAEKQIEEEENQE